MNPYEIKIEEVRKMKLDELYPILCQMKEEGDPTSLEIELQTTRTTTKTCPKCQGTKQKDQLGQLGKQCKKCKGNGYIKLTTQNQIQEIDINYVHERVKYGFKLNFPITYYLNKWYNEYPSTKNVTVLGFGTCKIWYFTDEIEKREILARRFILEAISTPGNIQVDDTDD